MEGHWYPCLGRLPLNLATMRPECRELWTLRPVFQKSGPAGGRADRAPSPAGRPGATAGPGREAETEGGGENRSDHRARENAGADEREARHSARNALARPCRGGEVVKRALPSDRVAARDHGLGPLRPWRRPRRRRQVSDALSRRTEVVRSVEVRPCERVPDHGQTLCGLI